MTIASPLFTTARDTAVGRWLAHERFGILGLGKSGVSAVLALCALGKRVVASDTRALAEIAEAPELLAAGAEVLANQNAAPGAEVVVTSPGLPPSLGVFAELEGQGTPVISELELAFALSKAPWVAITGTDGKTTTTTLVGQIFARAGHPTTVAGNIGTPLCDVVQQTPAQGWIVAEVSSFQLRTIHDFQPAIAAFTNVTSDHLDYHGTLDAYAGCKRALIARASARDSAVFNFGDPTIRAWSQNYPGRAIGYGLSGEGLQGCAVALWQADNALWVREGSGAPRLWCPDRASLPLRGDHNTLNMLCAGGVALAAGISLDVVAAALGAFEPLAHRVQPLGQVGGVAWYDDSKATNVHAALAGLRAIGPDFVAIVGGVDKGLDLAPLLAVLAREARAVVTLGELAPRLEQEAPGAGLGPERMQRATTMEQAVQLAHEAARKSLATSVILSPACSSFDMFRSYAHRGQVFQAAVRALDIVPADPAH